MNHTVPYYLLNSAFGTRASKKIHATGSRSDETPKWRVLPLSIFGNSDESQKDEDGDFREASQAESAGKNDLAQRDKTESKDGADGEQAPVETSPGLRRVGMNIPFIPDEDDTQSACVPPFPTQWNRKEKSAGLEISPNGLRVIYTGEASTDPPENNARSVRANYHIPPQCGIFYYEVSIMDRSNYGHSKSIIGIGVSHANVLLNRLPGWEEGSWGYHGDDGNCFCNSGSGKVYGPTYTAGDVIGCIIDYVHSTVSFTKNGTNLGVAFSNIKCEQNTIPTLYPIVGLQTHGETIEANFGHKKFVFDIEDYVMEQKNKIWSRIMASPLILNADGIGQSSSPNSPESSVIPMHYELDIIFDIVKRLMFSYLIHSGYVDTVKRFHESLSLGKSHGDFYQFSGGEKKKRITIASEFMMGKDNDKEALENELRDAATLKSINNLLLDGEIDSAIKLIEASYPGFLEQNRNIDFALHCRKYVEIVYKFNETMINKRKSSDIAQPGQSEDQGSFPPVNGASDPQDWTSHQESDGVCSPSPGECGALSSIVECGQDIYRRFMLERNPTVISTLVKVFSLSSYPNAFECPVSYLLDIGCRKVIADSVNKAILVFMGYSCASALEIFYRHAAAVLEKLASNGIYSAALLDIKNDCLDGNCEIMHAHQQHGYTTAAQYKRHIYNAMQDAAESQPH